MKPVQTIWAHIGVKLDPEEVAEHLGQLEQWLARKPKTITNMSAEERDRLSEEIAAKVAKARADLVALRETESVEQRAAREERRQRLEARNRLLSQRDGEI